MIEYEARKKAAELVRCFVAGKITSHQLEDLLPPFNKDHIGSLFWFEEDYKYNDRLIVFPEEKRKWASLVLFLRNNFEYRDTAWSDPFWPFASQEEYDYALAHSVYLTEKSSVYTNH